MKTGDSTSPRLGYAFRVLLLGAAILMTISRESYAQRVSAYGGLGVNYYKANSITNFLNSNGIGSVRPGGCTSAVQFFLGAGYAVTSDWEVGAELDYMINSYTGNSGLGSQQVSLSYLIPSLTVRRLIRGEGYSLRFGGAFGYHFGSLSVSSPYSNQTQDYTATGFGMKLDGSLDTKLDEKLYARVGVHVVAELIGQPKAADGSGLTYTDYYSGGQTAVNMEFVGAGVSLGLVYYF